MPSPLQVQRVLGTVLNKVDQVPVPIESPARTATGNKIRCEDYHHAPHLKKRKKSIAYQAYIAW